MATLVASATGCSATTKSSGSRFARAAPGKPSGGSAPNVSSGAIVRVRIETEMGAMTFDIYEAQAPIAARNFLRYVDEDRLEGASFYRTVTLDNQPNNDVKIEVIQGGLGESTANALPPIEHETTQQSGIRHLDGTLSMARMDIGTAASDFFVCIGDQPELDFGGKRNPDGQGFAAFGRLVQGGDVARMIHRQSETNQQLMRPVKITSVDRVK